MAASQCCAGARNREGEVTLCKATARTFKAGQQYSDMPDRGGCCAFDHNNLAGFPVRRSPHVLLGDLGKRDAECWLRTAWVRPAPD